MPEAVGNCLDFVDADVVIQFFGFAVAITNILHHRSSLHFGVVCDNHGVFILMLLETQTRSRFRSFVS